jgi:hypothetical protein
LYILVLFWVIFIGLALSGDNPIVVYPYAGRIFFAEANHKSLVAVSNVLLLY